MLKILNDFEIEEQDVLNHTTQNEDLRTFTRQEVIKKLDFVLAINTDEDVFYLYEGLRAKLSNITDEEWANVRDVLPFNLLYSDEDRVSPEETLPLS